MCIFPEFQVYMYAQAYVHICAYMGATPLHMGSPWIGGQCFFHHLFNFGNYIWHDSPLN